MFGKDLSGEMPTRLLIHSFFQSMILIALLTQVDTFVSFNFIPLLCLVA